MVRIRSGSMRCKGGRPMRRNWAPCSDASIGFSSSSFAIRHRHPESWVCDWTKSWASGRGVRYFDQGLDPGQAGIDVPDHAVDLFARLLGAGGDAREGLPDSIDALEPRLSL